MELSCARSRAYEWKESKEGECNVPEAAKEDPVASAPGTEPGAGDAAECAEYAMDEDMEDDGFENEDRIGGVDEDEDAAVLVMCSKCKKQSQSVIECCKCLQGFHVDGGSGCNPLGVGPTECRALLSLQDFQCPSCTSQQHHCHMCKKEGSCTEGKETLFMCLLSNCTLLHCSDCQRGESQSTICPIHVCSECGTVGSKDHPLIECRHCSTSYHEACLPETLLSDISNRISFNELKMVCPRHNSEETIKAQSFEEDILELWRQSMARKLPDIFKACPPMKAHRKRKRAIGTTHQSIFNIDHLQHDEKSANRFLALRSGEVISGDSMLIDTTPAGPNTPENQPRAKGCKSPVSHKKTGGKAIHTKIVYEKTQRMEDPASELAEEGDESDEDEYSDGILFGCNEARQNISMLFTEAVQKHRDIRKRIKVYYPHDNQPPRPVPWAKLHKLETLNKAWSENKISEEVYRRDISEYVRLRQTIDRYLGPLCHGDRYTSFGRHFTKPDIMDRVVERVMEYIADGDIVVDMTCGANTFVPAIKKKAKEKGGKVSGKAFDVILPFNPEDWERNSWFNVEPKDLWDGGDNGGNIDHIVVGINPPFGMNGNLAGKFVQKSADLQVRMMFLIVPPKTQNPHGYSVVHLDSDLCQKRSSRGSNQEKGAAFYLPSNNQESWSAVTPEFRILKRVDPEVCADLRFLGKPLPSKAMMISPAPITEAPGPVLAHIKRSTFLQNQENETDFELHRRIHSTEAKKVLVSQTNSEALMYTAPGSFSLTNKEPVNHQCTPNVLAPRLPSSLSQIQETEEGLLGRSRGLLTLPSKPLQVASQAEVKEKNKAVIHLQNVSMPSDRLISQIPLNSGVQTQSKETTDVVVNSPSPAAEKSSRLIDGCGTITLPCGLTVRRAQCFLNGNHLAPNHHKLPTLQPSVPGPFPLQLQPPPPPPPPPPPRIPPPPPPPPPPRRSSPLKGISSLPAQLPVHAQEPNLRCMEVDLRTLQIAQTKIMSTAESHRVTNFQLAQKHQAQATPQLSLDSHAQPFWSSPPSGAVQNIHEGRGLGTKMTASLGQSAQGEMQHHLETFQLDPQNWSSGQPGEFSRQGMCPMREIRTTEVIEYRNRNESNRGIPLQGSGNLL